MMTTRVPTHRRLKAGLSGALLLGAVVAASPVAAQMARVTGLGSRSGTGEGGVDTNLLNKSFEDLRVKVIGGHVRVKRVRSEAEWRFFPAWQDLTFDDSKPSPDERPATINRGDFAYERDTSADRPTWRYDARRTIVSTDTGYRWRNRAGDWIRYDADGQLQALGERNGEALNFKRNGDGQISEVVDRNGEVALTIAYNGAGRISQVTGRGGRTVSYAYNGGHLVEVTDVRGNTISYSYTTKADKQVLAQRTDAAGRVVEYQYNVISGNECVPNGGGDWTASASRASSSGGGGNTAARMVWSGGCEQLQIPETVYLSAISDAAGVRKRFRYSYNDNGDQFIRATQTGRRVEQVVYNNDGELVRRVVNGETVERYNYTDTGYEKTDALGHKTRIDRNRYRERIRAIHPDDSSESWSYNAHGQVTRYVDEVGTVTEHSYDDSGNRIKTVEAKGSDAERVIKYGYDDNGQRTSRTLVGDDNTEKAVTRWSYDAYGNVTQRTGPEGETTQFKDYTARGNWQKRIDPRGNAWTRSYDKAGNLTQRQTPDGHTTSISYNAVGQRTSIQRPGRPKPTQFDYNDAGQLISVIDPAGNKTTTRYGDHRKPVKITDRAGRTMTIRYTDRGQRRQITDGAGNAISYTYGDPNRGAGPGELAAIEYPNQKRSYRYNKRGRRTAEIRTGNSDATRQVTRYRYDAAGRRDAVVKPGGNETTYEFDGLGRQIRRTKPDGNTVTTTYDDAGNTVSVTNEKGVTIRRYEHNRRGERTMMRWPGGETQRYSYDAAGNRVQHTKADGSVVKHSYNADGERTATRHFTSASAEAPEKTVTFSYNAAGNRTGYTDDTKSASYSYNARQQRTGATVDFGPFEKSYSTAYNGAGEASQLTYPGARTMDYSYDNAGRLKQVGLPEGSITVQAFHGFQPERVLYPGGSTVTTDYDGLGRPTRIQTDDPAGDPLMDERYRYNERGLLSRKQTQDSVRNYQYDAVQRLTQVTDGEGGTLFRYDYDAASNRTGSKEHPDTWSYNANNQLTSYADKTLTYDANGNQTQVDGPEGQTNYDYNTADRLADYHGPDGTEASYAYDPQGRRIKKTVDGDTRYFLYNQQGLIGVYDADGNALATYGWRPNTPWNTDPLWRHSDGETHYYATDRLATPVILFNSTGAKQWHSERTPFRIENLNKRSNSIGFPGQYRDGETGLDYNLYRYYRRGTGRYIKPDPIGLNGGMNSYAYTASNPIDRVDPKGLFYVPYFNDDGYPFDRGETTGACGSDGGKKFPDVFPNYSFTEACRKHDLCYTNCNTSKKECDREFLHNLLDSCPDFGPREIRKECRERAANYYRGVDSLGDSAYEAAQKENCGCSKRSD